MGIESDQVVYEYLSRVGDVAQQRQLPSAARMRLVAGLRNEIDRRRARAPVDSPAAVRRIVARLGSPDDVVDAAAGTGATAGPGDTTGTAGGTATADVPAARPDARETAAAVPVQRDGEDGGTRRTRGFRRLVPRPRPAAPVVPEPPDVPSPPHRASVDELGDSADQPDWWRVDSSPWGVGDEVPGFTGGVEIPELLKRPPKPKDADGPAAGKKDEDAGDEGKDAGKGAGKAEKAAADAKAGEGEGTESGGGSRRLLPRLPAAGWSNPLLLLAAASLVAGAVLGNWWALLIGWVIAYASRRLTENETKWAVMILPGLAGAAGVLWLWGRAGGRWGEPIAEGHMNDAVAETWPWVVRGAAVASALFLVWRSQRTR
ncbi:MAG TPA: hypothetical protein VFP69_13955 [Streptomyces sp.]|nr:hypothetical protein [Streptomyces sp.]